MHRSRRKTVLRLVAGPCLALAAACSSSGGTDGGGEGARAPDPPGDLALSVTGTSVTAGWTPVRGMRGYRLYWTLDATLAITRGTAVSVTAPPHTLADLPGGSVVRVAVASIEGDLEGLPGAEVQTTVGEAGGGDSGGSQYFPDWADVEPSEVLALDHDPGKSAEQNGAALRSLVLSLLPGQRLEIGSGTFALDSRFGIHLAGTAEAPIWIVAKEGATPVVTRAGASQNTIDVDHARYLCLRGLEITGGSIALRMHDCSQVWIDRCHVHDSQDNAIAANSQPTDHLYFTRNEVHSTGGTGEGFYIGGNHASPISHHGVIALNHVYDTAGSQGDGIELKQGSYAYWIAENVVHDTQYPCILVYGTGGEEPNLIERNLCWNAGADVMQVQGEAIVRNNVLMYGSGGFASHDHQGESRDLVFVHNTIVNDRHGARLSSWGGREGMVFANNVVYSQSYGSIVFSGTGSAGVDVRGNVVVGSVVGVTDGFTIGGGLDDFVDASWDGTRRDVTPTGFGAIPGMGVEAFVTEVDFHGVARELPVDPGAVDVK